MLISRTTQNSDHPVRRSHRRSASGRSAWAWTRLAFVALWVILQLPELAVAKSLPEPGQITEIVLVPRPSPKPRPANPDRPPVIDRLGTLPWGSIVEVPESVVREPTTLRTNSGYRGRFFENVRVIDIPDFQFPPRDLPQKPTTIRNLNSRYLYLSASDLEPVEGAASQPGMVRMRVRQQARVYRSEFRTRPLYSAEEAVQAIEHGRRVVEGRATPCPNPTPGAPLGPTPVPRPSEAELRRASTPAPTATPTTPDRPAGSREQTEAELQRAQRIQDIQPISDRERRLLEAIRRSGAQIPLLAVKRLIFFMRHPAPGGTPSNSRYITIADLSANSSQLRNHIIDLESLSIQTVAVAHGRGIRGENSRDSARVFGNANGSNLTPIGFMVATGGHATWEQRNGTPALSMRGLQRGINDLNEQRGIIIHGADYVSNERARAGQAQGRSQGCLVYDPRTARWVRQNLQQSLFMVYGGIERSIDYARDRY